MCSGLVLNEFLLIGSVFGTVAAFYLFPWRVGQDLRDFLLLHQSFAVYSCRIFDSMEFLSDLVRVHVHWLLGKWIQCFINSVRNSSMYGVCRNKEGTLRSRVVGETFSTSGVWLATGRTSLASIETAASLGTSFCLQLSRQYLMTMSIDRKSVV